MADLIFFKTTTYKESAMVSNNRVRQRFSIIVLIISCAVLSWVGHHYVTKDPKGSVELNLLTAEPDPDIIPDDEYSTGSPAP